MLSRNIIRSCQNVSKVIKGRLSSSASSGLNFDLSDEQRQIQETALKFAKEEIIPKAAHYDKTGEYPWDLIKRAFSLGFLSYEIPVEYGGQGLNNVESVLIAEALRFVYISQYLLYWYSSARVLNLQKLYISFVCVTNFLGIDFFVTLHKVQTQFIPE